MKKIFCCAIVALLATFAANAQEPTAIDEPSTSSPEPADTVDWDRLLDEVTVTVTKPVIQSNGERVTYNLGEDPQSKSATVMEMLRKVPLVTVDGQDNIQVNGQSSFKILVNGKENPMLSANAKMVLKAMPASAVRKIEVITEPGAKYDAEGVGGIINIITESQTSTDGRMLTLRAQGSNRSTGASLYGIAKKRNLTASASYNFSRQFPVQSMSYTLDREFFAPEGSSHIIGTGRQKDGVNFHNGSLDMSWEPNDNNLFTVTASAMIGTGDQNGSINQAFTNPVGSSVWSYLNHNGSSWKWGSVSAAASYQHTLGREGHNIIASYLYSHGVNSNKSDTEYDDIVNFPVDYPFMRNDVRNPTNEHTLQFDYVNPFSTHHSLESGAKAIFRRNSSRGTTYYSPDGAVYTPSPTDQTDMRQFQDVAALYASYSGTYGKWKVKGGLRYEHTYMGCDFLNHTMPDFSTRLDDVVPNGALAYSPSPASSLRLSYQMRISRPSVSQLNPYRDESNPLEVTFGNPDLTSERANNLSLVYSNFAGPVGINATLSHSITTNTISQYSYNQGSTVYTTYANTGTVNHTNLSLYLNFNFFSKVKWSIYSNVGHAHYHFADKGIRSGGWGYFATLNLTYDMPRDFRLSANGGLGSGTPGMQSKFGTFTFYSLGLTKSLLRDKRLEITLNASNFLVPMRFNMRQWTDDSQTRLKIKSPRQEISLSVSYRFGGLDGSVKRTATSIENDDVDNSRSSQGVDIKTN